MIRYILICVGLIGGVSGNSDSAQPVQAKTAFKGSGLPIPRFVMTKANKVNLRAGPGNNYPTRVVYNRKNIPLMVIAEFDFWRKIKDMDGQEGWIHKTLLSNTMLVWVKTEMASLISDPTNPETVMLKAEKGVEGEFLKDIKGKYAKVRIANQKGWMLIDALWGVIPE
jgi:SH3-like domain-containing protein